MAVDADAHGDGPGAPPQRPAGVRRPPERLVRRDARRPDPRRAERRRTARISSQAGAISKDTWVLASEPERLTGFWLQSGPAVERIDPMASIPSRVAENLWWLGRYAERAEAVDAAAAGGLRPAQRLPGQRQLARASSPSTRCWSR